MGWFGGFFEEIEGFQWDAANSEKNWHRHQVRQAECEQLFLNRPLVVAGDSKHSVSEVRFFALGRTDASRELAVVFTVRTKLIRVVSARPMSRRERRIYGKAKTEDEGA